MFAMQLAEALGKGLGEIMAMSADEFVMWFAYFKAKAEGR